MRKEYDLKNLKIKRRGLLPQAETASVENIKNRITISLDKEVIDYFKDETQINQALRCLLPNSKEHSEFYAHIKSDLLHDQNFIFSLKDILSQNNIQNK